MLNGRVHVYVYDEMDNWTYVLVNVFPICFFWSKRQYIRQAGHLIKNLLVPSGTLVRKRVRLKPAAEIT
jgi:hypothetical protein